MTTSTVVVEKDGFHFQQRKVCVDKGKTNIGTVDVLSPDSLEQLASAIKAGLETEANAIQCYIAGKAVQMQRQAREAKKGGKMSKANYNRIWSSLDKQFLIDNIENLDVINSKIAEIYAAESE